MKDFVNLHVNTTFSIMNSLIKPSELFIKTKELGQSAVGVCDSSTLSSAWDCLKYSREADVKLIMGCEFYFVDDLSDTTSNKRLRLISLIAKNHQGYKNLLMAGKLANDNHIIAFKKVIPRLDWKILEQVKEGLICLTSGCSGILSQLINSKKTDEAKIQAAKLKEIFGDNLAIELQTNHLKNGTPNSYRDYVDQDQTNRILFGISKELNIKAIPTTDAHFLTADKHEAHDVLVAIGSGQPVRSNARLKYTPDFCLKTRDEVVSFFSRWSAIYGDVEVLCDNTLYFANLCEKPDWIDPKFSRPAGVNWELPTFPVKDQPDYIEFKTWLSTQNAELQAKPEDVTYLKYIAELNLVNKGYDKEEYRKRLEKELYVLEVKNLSSYMLIVADYVNWAKNNNIPSGTGRGSIGGVMTAYLIDIHEADPIKYGLIFERFYNLDRSVLGDIDHDVSQQGKPLVEAYLRKKYGEDNCAQVSNFSTLTPKPYAKSIARAFMYGGDQKTAVAIGNKIAESIPKEFHHVTSALEKASLFIAFAESKEYHELKKFGADIGNKTYNYSTHAGANIICSRPLVEIVPVRRTKDNLLSIEYEKERAEANGLAKMDILGLSTLDIIADIFKIIKENGKELPPLPWNYDLNDTKAYELIGKGDTYGVFQFGTSGNTINLCKKMQPKNIEDLAAITALTRPGVPKEFREQFLEAKFNNTEVKLLHPCLNRSLQPTYGIAVFDECMLTLGEDVAGWDLNESDRLRKFIKDKGKHPEKDEKLKKDFIAATTKNINDPIMAKKLWEDLFANFNAYLFNKAHAVNYSFLSYQTAYLKANYPLEFLVANLNHESESNSLDASNNILKAKDEIRKLKVNILPPDINKSEKSYKIVNDNTVLTGFDSLKFIGNRAIPEIIAKRPFTSFEDFLTKVDGRKVPAPSVLALAASGSLDSFGVSRKTIYHYASDYKKKLAVWNKKNSEKISSFNYPWPEDNSDWTKSEQYAMEIKYIGEGLSGNLREAYPGFFDNRAINFNKLAKTYPNTGSKDQVTIDSASGTIEGVIKDYFEFKVKKEGSKILGETMAKIVLEDPFGNTIGMTCFPSKLTHFKNRLEELNRKVTLEPGIAIHCSGFVNWYEGEISILFDDLKRCTPVPPQPSDLKPRKVSMKITGKSKKKSKEVDSEEFLEEVEDELVEEGLVDLNVDDEILDFDDQESNSPDGFI